MLGAFSLRPRRSFSGRRLLAATVLACAVCTTAGACGEPAGEAPPEPPPPVQLTIWNRTLFSLEEIRVHGSESYQSAANELTEPLADEGQFDVETRTGHYVTVIRRLNEAGSRVAFTTAHGLTLPDSGYTLVVLQESFRLLAPGDTP